jgi:hypothetical protein
MQARRGKKGGGVLVLIVDAVQGTLDDSGVPELNWRQTSAPSRADGRRGGGAVTRDDGATQRVHYAGQPGRQLALRCFLSHPCRDTPSSTPREQQLFEGTRYSQRQQAAAATCDGAPAAPRRITQDTLAEVYHKEYTSGM